MAEGGGDCGGDVLFMLKISVYYDGGKNPVPRVC
jgi:hypothetical protein